MSDWHCIVCKIEKVIKHPDADNLSIATVLGDYPVIIKTGQFSEGQLVSYLSVDTIVPDTEEFYFLCPNAYEKYEEEGEINQRQVGKKYMLGSVPEKYRILKSKRIRGTYSQGLLIEALPGLSEGDSIIESLGLKKWEEEEEDNIPNAKKNRGANAAKAPIGWAIPYYDIDGLRKYISCLNENEEIVLTEKIHGSNSAFVHDGEKLWVKSRNFYKRFDEDDSWWDVAIRYQLAEKLAQFPRMVFFGELYGQVKGFRYDCEIENGTMNTKIRFFDIFDLDQKRYLDYDPFVAMVKEAGLPLVPELYRGIWANKELMYSYAEGKTTLGGKHTREGFVLRTTKERYEPKLDARMQIKLVGEGYNLAK